MADKKYRVLVGINYGPEGKKRAEPGDVVAEKEIKRSIGWLLEQRIIEPLQEGGEV